MPALKAAVHNGADAVYLGLGAFNARAKAANFDLNALKEALEFAHFFGVRVYVAFNTLLKDAEVNRAAGLAGQAAELGADALILQDLGLLAELQRRGVKTEFHASTQLGVHNLEGAIVAKKLGFSRVILSRETLLEDIVKIKNGTDLALEYFVHGALCVAFSGNCYFSSLLSGESGNRGRCLQFCRKPYSGQLAVDSGQGNGLLRGQGSGVRGQGSGQRAVDSGQLKASHLLSPRDLNLSAHLKTLADAGICSFKIEGRMRRAEYVGEAVRVYKKALTQPLVPSDRDGLKIIFNRGDYCEGYFKEPTSDIIYSAHPAHIGLKVGSVKQITNYKLQITNKDENTPAAKSAVQIRYEENVPVLTKGDGIKFVRDGSETGSALVSNPDMITFTGDVRPGDEVRLTSCAELSAEVLARRRHIALKAYVGIKAGEPAVLTLTDGAVSVTRLSASPAEISATSPLKAENVRRILAQTGDETIVMSDIVIDLGDNCFLPVSELKNLRRDAIAKFREEKLSRYRRPTDSGTQNHPADSRTQNHPADSGIQSYSFAGESSVARFFSSLRSPDLFKRRRVFVMLEDAKDVTDELLNACDYAVLNPRHYALAAAKEFVALVGKKKAVLNLPNVMRGGDAGALRQIVHSSGIENFIVNNLYGFELCREKTVIAGFMMNFLNSATHSPIAYIASVESEKPVSGAVNYIYGRVPLMTLSFCPQKNFFKASCGSCKGSVEGSVEGSGEGSGERLLLLDERGVRFPLRRFKTAHCYRQVLNSLPLDNREVLHFADCSVLIDLTDEPNPAEKLREILQNLHSPLPHTHGNYKRELR